MSNYYYGPALDTELDYRRGALRHDADVHRLAREARRVARSGRRLGIGHRTMAAQPAPAVRTATPAAGASRPGSPRPPVPTGTSEASARPTGGAASTGTRAA